VLAKKEGQKQSGYERKWDSSSSQRKPHLGRIYHGKVQSTGITEDIAGWKENKGPNYNADEQDIDVAASCKDIRDFEGWSSVSRRGKIVEKTKAFA